MTWIFSSFQFRSHALATMLICLFIPQVQAQDSVEIAGSFPTNGTEEAPVLIGAMQANARLWPATLVFMHQKNLFSPIERCSATVIGPMTVLTAAHCMPNGAVAKVKLASGGNLKVKCTHHPDYLDDTSQDFALCVSNAAFTGFRFEKINTDTAKPALNAQVKLMGFGCREEAGVDKAFGVLFEGPATVKSRFANGRNYIRTAGGAAVCFGDSGGGAFIVANANATLFGVNSRGDISENSYLSTTANPAFLAFLDTWVATTNAGAICGRGADAALCRSGM